MLYFWFGLDRPLGDIMFDFALFLCHLLIFLCKVEGVIINELFGEVCCFFRFATDLLDYSETLLLLQNGHLLYHFFTPTQQLFYLLLFLVHLQVYKTPNLALDHLRLHNFQQRMQGLIAENKCIVLTQTHAARRELTLGVEYKLFEYLKTVAFLIFDFAR